MRCLEAELDVVDRCIRCSFQRVESDSIAYVSSVIGTSWPTAPGGFTALKHKRFLSPQEPPEMALPKAAD